MAKCTVSIKSCCNLKNFFLLSLIPRQSPWTALFSWKIQKNTFVICLTRKKHFVKHIENLPQHLSENFIGDNSSITDITWRNWDLSIIGIAQSIFEIIDYRYRFSTERFIVPITDY